MMRVCWLTFDFKTRFQAMQPNTRVVYHLSRGLRPVAPYPNRALTHSIPCKRFSQCPDQSRKYESPAARLSDPLSSAQADRQTHREREIRADREECVMIIPDAEQIHYHMAYVPIYIPLRIYICFDFHANFRN